MHPPAPLDAPTLHKSVYEADNVTYVTELSKSYVSQVTYIRWVNVWRDIWVYDSCSITCVTGLSKPYVSQVTYIRWVNIRRDIWVGASRGAGECIQLTHPMSIFGVTYESSHTHYVIWMCQVTYITSYEYEWVYDSYNVTYEWYESYIQSYSYDVMYVTWHIQMT